MRRTSPIAIAAAVVAIAASSASAAGGHRVTMIGRVCDRPMILSDSRPYPVDAASDDVRVDAFVDGHRLLGLVSGRSVYMVGQSTIVQADVKTRRFAVRAVRTVETCATLKVVFTWSTPAKSPRSSSSSPGPVDLRRSGSRPAA